MSKKWVEYSLTIATFWMGAAGCAAQNGTDQHSSAGGAATGGSASGASTGGSASGGSTSGGPSSGGSDSTITPEPHWSDACSEEDPEGVLFSTNDEGCRVCTVLASDVAPKLEPMKVEGPSCGGRGMQLGSGWIGCGWVFTRAWGDQGDGPYESRYKIIDTASNLGGASGVSEEPEDGVLRVVYPIYSLDTESPAECSYALYGEQDFPKDCDSWKQVCCPPWVTGSDCDETMGPFE